MIFAEIWYETHDGKLLAIVETFKTWWHYLEDCKYEVLVFTNHNNLCQFMNKKSLSSRQIHWAKEYSHYRLQINYCQGKANRAANALFWYPQRSAEKEKIFRAKNVNNHYYLQSSLAKVFRLSTSHFSLLHQIFICKTTILLWLNNFWNTLQAKLNNKGPYKDSISAIHLKL